MFYLLYRERISKFQFEYFSKKKQIKITVGFKSDPEASFKLKTIFFPFINFQERLSHGISGSGFGSAPRSDFQHPYFPPPFPQQTAQDVFAQNPHLAAAAADPYNVNSLHSFQTSQVFFSPSSFRKKRKNRSFYYSLDNFHGSYALNGQKINSKEMECNFYHCLLTCLNIYFITLRY
jgi:hypothetical protein